MCSYVPKKNRAVVPISSMHHDNEGDVVTKKPENILDNITKEGVDEADRKAPFILVAAGREDGQWWYSTALWT